MVAKYTKEQTEKILAAYQEALDDERYDPIPAIAEEFGVTTRSLRAKLSSLKVYKRKTYVDKRGLPPVKKDKYVEEIAKILNKDPESLESLEKVNKSILILILESLTKSRTSSASGTDLA